METQKDINTISEDLEKSFWRIIRITQKLKQWTYPQHQTSERHYKTKKLRSLQVLILSVLTSCVTRNIPASVSVSPLMYRFQSKQQTFTWGAKIDILLQYPSISGALYTFWKIFKNPLSTSAASKWFPEHAVVIWNDRSEADVVWVSSNENSELCHKVQPKSRWA